jgi:hypothetical protein
MPRAGARLLRSPGMKTVFFSASFSPDGSRIVTASGRTARIWDAESGRKIAALTGHGRTVPSVSFSPDGSRIVTASHDDTARVWVAGTKNVSDQTQDTREDASLATDAKQEPVIAWLKDQLNQFTSVNCRQPVDGLRSQGCHLNENPRAGTRVGYGEFGDAGPVHLTTFEGSDADYHAFRIDGYQGASTAFPLIAVVADRDGDMNIAGLSRGHDIISLGTVGNAAGEVALMFSVENIYDLMKPRSHGPASQIVYEQRVYFDGARFYVGAQRELTKLDRNALTASSFVASRDRNDISQRLNDTDYTDYLLDYGPNALCDLTGALCFDVQGVESDDVLNVREEPDYRSQKVGELLPFAQRIQVQASDIEFDPLRIKEDWVEISWCSVGPRDLGCEGDFVSGWVNSRYLSPSFSGRAPSDD